MKVKIILTIIIAILLSISVYSDEYSSCSPGRFVHHIKNSTNDLVRNQVISVKISILSGSPNGEPIYVETHQPKTANNGYISVDIGQGQTVLGSLYKHTETETLCTVNRKYETYYLKTEIDPTGNNNYSLATPIIEEIKKDEFQKSYGLIDEPFFESFDGKMLIWVVSFIFILAVIQIILYIRNRSRAMQRAKEKAVRIAKSKKEQAIQDEIFRKEQAKYEEEERIREQKELEIWNSKSPNEKAKIKFKEMEDAIHSLNGYYADDIFREWESEFEKYVAKNEIISAKDKIFQLRLLDMQERQRQREIKEERDNQRARDYQNDRIRREQEKDNKKWYCPKCGRVVPGRNSPTDRNCIGGKSHEWQLRS